MNGENTKGRMDAWIKFHLSVIIIVGEDGFMYVYSNVLMDVSFSKIVSDKVFYIP